MKAFYIAIILLIFQLGAIASDDFSVQSGVLDLRGWDFTEEPVVAVDGDWLFYWGEHLPVDFYAQGISVDFIEMQVPGVWNNVNADTSFPAHGIATYYLKIILDAPRENFVLNVKPVATSMRLYVNGLLCAKQGKAGETEETTRPTFYHRMAFLDEADSDNGNYVYHVVVHVSNFHLDNGGIRDYVKFGKTSVIIHRYFNGLFWSLLISGILIMIFLHHLLISLFAWNLKRFLFSIIVFFVFLLSITNEGRLIYFAIPNISFATFLKLSYIASYCLPLVLLYYLRELYPQENKKIVVQFFTFAYALVFTFIITFPTDLISKYSFVYSFLLGITALYILLPVVGLAVIRNRKGSIYVLVPLSIVVVSGINDVFLHLNIIQSIYISHLGLLIFVFIQEFYLMSEFLMERKHSLQFAKKLRALNKNLEEKVSVRTKKQENQNQELKKQAVEIQSRNRELEQLQIYQEKLTHMLVHDLKAPIGTILHLTEVIKTPDKNFVDVVRESTNRMQFLVHNLLDIRRLETAGMPVDIEGLRLADVLNESKKHMLYQAKAKNVNIIVDVKVHFVVYADKNLLVRVVTNLLDNAIKHVEENAEIRISVENSMLKLAPSLRIVISDNGSGIPDDIQATLFDSYKSKVKQTEHFRSHGLGLAFCKMAIEAMHGEICIESDLGKGTQVFIDLSRVKLQ
ncbi:MAG: sensor histidine kinase [Bacteroidales bacterium]|jgi:signal transduction histidine kinase|nr:sensor histidine kinase [Bacteroidales bacterium]